MMITTLPNKTFRDIIDPAFFYFSLTIFCGRKSKKITIERVFFAGNSFNPVENPIFDWINIRESQI